MLRRIPSSRLLPVSSKPIHSIARLNGRRLVLGGCLGASIAVLVPYSQVECSAEGKGDEKGGAGNPGKLPFGLPDKGDEAIQAAITALQPIVSKLGFGGIMGLTSGYALKRIGKAAAFMTGCAFVFLQSLAYAGLIEIKWAAIEKKVEATIDVDGDGKFDAKDVMALWEKHVKPMLTHGLPSAGGFSMGFFMGVKYM
mmetsp:Transcript_36763/g.62483  ORF Transcript_36763/g.62483 Transcript_36763/m.62483 type:complete len:197 (+) Transcript_36763:47-637(+)